ncbi:MAG: hypothetical protein LLG20_16530 [Acidobacteriales bacterium]|nr:hypothetical protein [Terriglobales bacterium]
MARGATAGPPLDVARRASGTLASNGHRCGCDCAGITGRGDELGSEGESAWLVRY